jgi:hypothetical protein
VVLKPKGEWPAVSDLALDWFLCSSPGGFLAVTCNVFVSSYLLRPFLLGAEASVSTLLTTPLKLRQLIESARVHHAADVLNPPPPACSSVRNCLGLDRCMHIANVVLYKYDRAMCGPSHRAATAQTWTGPAPRRWIRYPRRPSQPHLVRQESTASPLIGLAARRDFCSGYPHIFMR